VEIRIDQAALDRLLHHRDGLVGRDLQRRADRVARAARQWAPGSMPQQIPEPTINRRGAGDLSATIVSRHFATLFVVRGTPRHTIRPRPGTKALRFTVAGRTVFARVVNHPGTQPNDFLTKALREAI